MNEKAHIFSSLSNEIDEDYGEAFIKEAFDTNWIAPLEASANGFEKKIAERNGAKAAAAGNLGTAVVWRICAGEILFSGKDYYGNKTI